MIIIKITCFMVWYYNYDRYNEVAELNLGKLSNTFPLL